MDAKEKKDEFKGGPNESQKEDGESENFEKNGILAGLLIGSRSI